MHRREATVFVPTGNQALVSRMRQVLRADEIEKMIAAMPGEESIWIQDENDRKVTYKEILTEGDSHKLVQLIKTLYLHQQEQNAKGKKLRQTDERFFKEAEKMLYDQFALALHMKPEQVLPFILKRIGETECGKGGEAG